MKRLPIPPYSAPNVHFHFSSINVRRAKKATRACVCVKPWASRSTYRAVRLRSESDYESYCKRLFTFRRRLGEEESVCATWLLLDSAKLRFSHSGQKAARSNIALKCCLSQRQTEQLEAGLTMEPFWYRKNQMKQILFGSYTIIRIQKNWPKSLIRLLHKNLCVCAAYSLRIFLYPSIN